MQRVINTPVRGIGRSTLDTLERLALETGTSTWDAIAHAVRQHLLPQRALNALEAFQHYADKASDAEIKAACKEIQTSKTQHIAQLKARLGELDQVAPVPETGFVGRSRELLALQRLLRQERYAVVRGQGGV